MNAFFDTNHLKDKYFSTEDILQLTPEYFYAYLAKKAYGKADPTYIENPTHGRSSSLEFHKKAITVLLSGMLNTILAIQPSPS